MEEIVTGLRNAFTQAGFLAGIIVYLLLTLVLFGHVAVFAGEQAGTGENEVTQESPLALDVLLVSLETGLTYDQEVMLRVIRQAYKKKRSKLDKDRDVTICWLGKPRSGYARGFLYCARNGDLRAQRLRSRLPGDKELEGWDGYGTVQVTTFPVKRRWLEDALAALPGSDEFDVELISMVRAGERPPLDIPDDEELDRFVPVWAKVGRPKESGNFTENQISMITDAEFSVVRYRQILTLVEVYQSINSEVNKRLK